MHTYYIYTTRTQITTLSHIVPLCLISSPLKIFQPMLLSLDSLSLFPNTINLFVTFILPFYNVFAECAAASPCLSQMRNSISCGSRNRNIG
ncbi:hypothetical protein RJT34_26512 [Clitoria ternatea]|uniref:Uncharacterized protein n=1 Tax=Clitoria ternatea TaxID=43366 RepID=A0AAN9F999_CLITE